MVAYRPSRPADQLGAGSHKVSKPTWDCTGCGTKNSIDTSFCANCKSGKGVGVPTEMPDHKPVHLNKGKTLKKKLRDYTVTGQPINPITGNVDGPTPPGHKSKQGVFASAHSERDVEVDDEDDDGVEEDVEFFQPDASVGAPPKTAQMYSNAPASGDAVQRLMGLIKKHDNRKKSFDALFGGPEHGHDRVI